MSCAKLMTIPKKISLVLMITAAVACSETKTERDDTDSETSSPSGTTSPDNTVLGFLRWYKGNEERLHQIPLLTGGLQDTTTFYSVDFIATELYLSELKKSGYLS